MNFSSRWHGEIGHTSVAEDRLQKVAPARLNVSSATVTICRHDIQPC